MTTRRTRKSTRLLASATGLAAAVPTVVGHRLTRMALAGNTPSRRDRLEFERMSAEKLLAFRQSWNAMAAETWRAQQAMGVALMRAFWTPTPFRLPTAAITTQLQNSALSVMEKGMAPVRRAAVANAKRLSRTRLR